MKNNRPAGYHKCDLGYTGNRFAYFIGHFCPYEHIRYLSVVSAFWHQQQNEKSEGMSLCQ